MFGTASVLMDSKGEQFSYAAYVEVVQEIVRARFLVQLNSENAAASLVLFDQSPKGLPYFVSFVQLHYMLVPAHSVIARKYS